MKSFSNSNEISTPRLVQAWMPVNFSRREEALQVAAQQLMDILGPLPQTDPIEPGADPHLIRAAYTDGRRLQSWNPANILQQSDPEWITSSPAAPETSFPPLPEKFSLLHSPRRPERRPDNMAQAQADVDEKKRVEITAESRSRADQLIQQAQTEAAEILERAKDEARQTVEEGFRKGYEDGRAETTSSIQAVQAMIAEASAWRDQIVTQNEAVVIDMIRRIARLMFGEGVQLDKGALQIYLNEVMETTRSLGELNIFLSPSDYEQLDPAWAEYYTQIRGIRVTVIGSNKILPGGCYIQGKMGTVDALVETKLNAVMETLASDAENGASE